MEKKVTGLLIVIVLLGAFVRCATVSSPQGGPKDSISPIFVGSNPLPYSTEFNKKRITLIFNENVQLKDQQKLFIMSPRQEKKPTLTVKGKNIVVDFEEDLDPDITYSLDFGSSVCDLTEGNKMEVFNFIFSTGKEIDTLVMNGQVIDAFTRDTVIGAFVFFYDAKGYDKTKLDSMAWNGNPDVISRTDSSGYFIADILKAKPYRIYALVDKNGNQLYEAGTDYIGYIDKDFNPVDESGFTMYYDSLTRRWNIDTLQAKFEVFLESPKKKQILLSSARPKQNLITLAFNAKDAVIDTLDLPGIPEEWQIHFWSKNHDSLSVWLNPPTREDLDAIPDTIKAHLAYQRTDSLWNMYTHSQNLNLKWKQYIPKKKKQQAQKQNKTFEDIIKQLFKKKGKRLRKKYQGDSTYLKKLIADSIKNDSLRAAQVADSIRKATRIKMSVNAEKSFVPTSDLIFTFEVPMDSVYSEGIKLWRLKKVIKKGKIVEDKRTAREAGEEVPFEFFCDSLDLMKWHIKSVWEPDDKYSLLIPENTFKNILGERNDSLFADFSVASPEQFGSIKINPVSQPSDTTGKTRYIYQVIQYRKDKEGSGKSPIVRFVTDVLPTDKFTIDYIKPGTGYRLRIIEDKNGNGIWDTGVLETHTPPEKVRVLTQKGTNNPVLLVKENWTVEFDIDYDELFR